MVIRVNDSQFASAVRLVCTAADVLGKPCDRLKHIEHVQDLSQTFSLEAIQAQMLTEIGSNVSGQTQVGRSLRKLLGL
jgi:hypothetical protein